MSDTSIFSLFVQAGLVVKLVMLLLLIASVISWTFIVQRYLVFKKAHQEVPEFEKQFWSGTDLSALYATLKETEDEVNGLSLIFLAGFTEFTKLRKQSGVDANAVMEGAQRAMRAAQARETVRLEKHLSFMATVGSISPYVGLFGTVWGIMNSFHGLGQVQQATIAMVAPGISEALVATAMGLFAAIPAVIAYNRYASQMDRLLSHYEHFQEEFSSILYRQAHTSPVRFSSNPLSGMPNFPKPPTDPLE